MASDEAGRRCPPGGHQPAYRGTAAIEGTWCRLFICDACQLPLLVPCGPGDDCPMDCDPGCELGPRHCWNWHRPSHKPDWHDPAACDAMAARRVAQGDAPS